MGLVVGIVSLSHAAPVTLTLQRTTALFNEDPQGAPLPLGRTQDDAGDVLLSGVKIGEYLMVKNVHAASQNVAAVTYSTGTTTLTVNLP